MLQCSSAKKGCPASATETGTASVHDPAITKLLQKESEQHEVIITFILCMHAYDLQGTLNVWPGNMHQWLNIDFLMSWITSYRYTLKIEEEEISCQWRWNTCSRWLRCSSSSEGIYWIAVDRKMPWVWHCPNKGKIMWYRGSYTTPWRPDKREQPSTVAAESIVVHGFQLTATGKLGTAVKNIPKESVQDY